MKKMMNITDCTMDTERYQDGADVMQFARQYGCDGIELMHCTGFDPGFFLPESIVGIHLRCHNEWVDLWKGNLEALEKEYGTLEQAEKVFGGLDRQSILQPLREELELAHRLGASYVVFHVSDVKVTELFTYQFQHTDEEVVDFTADLVNQLLDGKEYHFEFLMENLWWPGLTMTRPEITKRLLEQIHYPKKGIMLDTGHLMHMNLELKTQEEAVDYILEKVRAHGELAPYIRGMHLNQSLTGDYVKNLLKKQEQLPETYEEREYMCYEHVFQIDQHLPFSITKVRELVDFIKPEYLTHELITSSREEHSQRLKMQYEALEGNGEWEKDT